MANWDKLDFLLFFNKDFDCMDKNFKFRIIYFILCHDMLRGLYETFRSWVRLVTSRGYSWVVTVGETLYHHTAHSDGCRLENLPNKVSLYFCIQIEFILYFLIHWVFIYCFIGFLYTALFLLLYIEMSCVELRRGKCFFSSSSSLYPILDFLSHARTFHALTPFGLHLLWCR